MPITTTTPTGGEDQGHRLHEGGACRAFAQAPGSGLQGRGFDVEGADGQLQHVGRIRLRGPCRGGTVLIGAL